LPNAEYLKKFQSKGASNCFRVHTISCQAGISIQLNSFASYRKTFAATTFPYSQPIFSTWRKKSA